MLILDRVGLKLYLVDLFVCLFLSLFLSTIFVSISPFCLCMFVYLSLCVFVRLFRSIIIEIYKLSRNICELVAYTVLEESCISFD